MRKSLKGALLSGLVFPGYGQFVLKHYMRGIAVDANVFNRFGINWSESAAASSCRT